MKKCYRSVCTQRQTTETASTVSTGRGPCWKGIDSNSDHNNHEECIACVTITLAGTMNAPTVWEKSMKTKMVAGKRRYYQSICVLNTCLAYVYSNKLTSIEAMLVRNYNWSTNWLKTNWQISGVCFEWPQWVCRVLCKAQANQGLPPPSPWRGGRPLKTNYWSALVFPESV